MFNPKLDELLHELRLAPRFEWNFQAAQSDKLHVNVAHLSRPPTNPIEHLQQFLLIPVSSRDDFLQKNLHTPG